MIREFITTFARGSRRRKRRRELSLPEKVEQVVELQRIVLPQSDVVALSSHGNGFGTSTRRLSSTSEQRPLYPQRRGLDRLLAEEALHLARAGGAVDGEVVVEEAVDLLRVRRVP